MKGVEVEWLLKGGRERSLQLASVFCVIFVDSLCCHHYNLT